MNEVTTDGEYQMKFKMFGNNHLENTLDMIFENFDHDDRLEEILAKAFKAQNRDSFEDKLNLLTRINDNLCHILRSTGKFEVSKEDLLRKVRKLIYEQNLDITTDWNRDTDMVILRDSKRLDGAPLLSSGNRAWTLNVLDKTTNAGEYQMKFERRPDLMTDVERLLFPLLGVKKLETFQDFLLRKVCELICDRNINVYLEWGVGDTLILRGSKTSELTEIIRIRGLSCKFVYWKLGVVEDTTEDGEYQMKFKNVVDDSESSIMKRLKKVDECEILMSCISLPARLESFQRSLVRDVCGSICDNEWDILPEWNHTANALILRRRSNELDATKVPIGELACDNSYWKFNLLDETTQDGEYQMKFEKTARYDQLMHHSCHRDFAMPRMSLVSLPFRPLSARLSPGSSSLHPVSETVSQDTTKTGEHEKESEPIPELHNRKIHKDIPDPTSSVENLLSPILGVEGLGTTQQGLLREVCESIREKKLDISPEWGVGDKDKLILRGSKTSDATKISQIKGLTCKSYTWKLKVLEDMTEAEEYQMMFQPIPSFDVFESSTVSVSQESLGTTLLGGEKSDLDKSMSAGRRYQYHTQIRAQFLSEWMNDQLPRGQRFDYSQVDLLRKLCESIDDQNLDITLECRDIDRFILRGSERLDITEMSTILNLPRQNNFWKLRVLEETTEAGEYQLKFERNVEYQQGTDSMSAVDKLLSPILLAKKFGPPKSGLLRKLCESIIKKEWHITPEWHGTNRLILRGSKELDVTKNAIEDLSCKNDRFILRVLPYTTKGNEYQMNFEEITKVGEYRMPFEEIITDDDEIAEIIQDMSKVNNLLSHIQSKTSFPMALLHVFRTLCVSICAKEVPIIPEWDETTATLILRGSENLHVTPSVEGECYSLDVFPSSVTKAGEYRMRFKQTLKSFDPLRLFPVHSTALEPRTTCRWIEDQDTLTNADVMPDANSLLFDIQSANEFLPAQVDILRSLCISICKKKVDIVPHWDATTDTLILRGSANIDSFPLSYLGVGWSLIAFPVYNTEAREYRMKFSQDV